MRATFLGPKWGILEDPAAQHCPNNGTLTPEQITSEAATDSTSACRGHPATNEAIFPAPKPFYAREGCSRSSRFKNKHVAHPNLHREPESPSLLPASMGLEPPPTTTAAAAAAFAAASRSSRSSRSSSSSSSSSSSRRRRRRSSSSSSSSTPSATSNTANTSCHIQAWQQLLVPAYFSTRRHRVPCDQSHTGQSWT